MTKLGQVARAICEEIFGEDAHRPEDHDRNEGVQDACISAARAAVEALREPTEAMVGIGQVHEMYDTSAEINLDVWTAMIDAILSEKP